MLILGSCLALNLNYSGCCIWSLSQNCSNNGCFCDQNCYFWNDCCNDIADIGCHSAFLSSPTVSHTPIDTLGKTKSEAPYYIIINMCDKTMLLHTPVRNCYETEAPYFIIIKTMLY